MSELPYSPFGPEIDSDYVVTTMQPLTSWEDRYRQVIQWGKKLPVMPDTLKTEQVKVSGCESQVWLVGEQHDKQWFFCADSDARIVRGLIALVMAAFNGKTGAEIEQFDIQHYFQQTGLIAHLSPSRGNGLNAIVAQIKQQIAE